MKIVILKNSPNADMLKLTDAVALREFALHKWIDKLPLNKDQTSQSTMTSNKSSELSTPPEQWKLHSLLTPCYVLYKILLLHVRTAAYTG
jgi:hypothetical protein